VTIRRKGDSESAKIKVKKDNLEELFTKLTKAVQDNGLERKKAQDRFRTALEEDDLEEDYRRRMEPKNDSISTVPPMRFHDPGPSRKSSPMDARTASKMLVAYSPGDKEVHQIDTEFDRAKWKRFQDLNDALLLADVSLKDFSLRHSKYWPEFQGLHRQLVGKILQSGSASSGGDFVPTNLSSQLIPDFRQPLMVGSALPHITMTSPTFDSPLEGVEISPYYVTESTSNTTATTSNTIPNRNMTTSKVTWTARALKIRSWITQEATEDSIIAMLPYLRSNIGRSLGGGAEDAFINSDRSSAHQDNDVTEGSTDHRTSMTGLRVRVASDGKHTVQDSGGQLKATDFLAARTLMGKYADDPASNLLIVFNTVCMTHLVGDSNLMGMDKIGNLATLPRGTVGTIFGAPAITSGKIRTDLNVSGVNSGSGSLDVYTHALQLHKNAFVVGDRRDITIRSAEDIETDRVVVVGTWRGDIQQTYSDSSGERCITNVIGVSSTLTSFT